MVALEKRCSRCGETKLAGDFHRSAKEPCGLKAQCKPCVSLTAMGHKKRDPAKASASSAAWQKRNPDAKKRLAKANWERNRARYLVERKAEYEANKVDRREAATLRYATDVVFRERLKARAVARYKAKAETVKAYQKRYRAEQPEKVRALSNNARARQMAAEGKTTAAEWRECLEHFDHRCAYCLRHESEVGKLARDHMQPLTRGGSNWPENLVPACKSCNSSKNAKTPLEFARTSCGLAA